MCCCIADTPIESDRVRTFQTGKRFQTEMIYSPVASCPSFLWFTCQCFPLTACCTQYFLRRYVLDNDMSKYQCCQGYANLCGADCSGSCGESHCPHLCLCLESLCCNGFAVSASRMYVMDAYQLSSDPCDYRLIRISNCLQLLSCVCDILAAIDENFQSIAHCINNIADIVYLCVSGCMTSQTAFEVAYQNQLKDANKSIAGVRFSNSSSAATAEAEPIVAIAMPSDASRFVAHI